MATRKRVKQFYMLLGGIAVVGAGALAWVVVREPETAGGASPMPVVVGDAFEGFTEGSPDAPVEVVEYSDFECPYCMQFAVVQLPDIRRRLVETGRARWRFVDRPISQLHPNAFLAAHAAHCADDQGKFWQMHDMLYQRHRDWASRRRGAARRFNEFAKQLALDTSAFEACMDSEQYMPRIQASVDAAVAAGITSTPTFVVNGRRLPGVPTADELVRIVDSIAPVSQ